MTMPIRTLVASLVSFAGLAITAMLPTAARAALDGSAPMLCAIKTIMECDESGQFLRINVTERQITDGERGRKAEIQSASRLDGRLILQGGQNGRGWSATIAEDTGRMSAGVVAADFSLALFGACTTP